MKILKKFTRLSVSTQVVLLVIGLVLPVNMISRHLCHSGAAGFCAADNGGCRTYGCAVYE